MYWRNLLASIFGDFCGGSNCPGVSPTIRNEPVTRIQPRPAANADARIRSMLRVLCGHILGRGDIVMTVLSSILAAPSMVGPRSTRYCRFRGKGRKQSLAGRKVATPSQRKIRPYVAVAKSASHDTPVKSRKKLG